MHGDSVLLLEVDAFYNVNFAVVRPRRAEHPEGRPDAALEGWRVSDGEKILRLFWGTYGCAGHVGKV